MTSSGGTPGGGPPGGGPSGGGTPSDRTPSAGTPGDRTPARKTSAGRTQLWRWTWTVPAAVALLSLTTLSLVANPLQDYRVWGVVVGEPVFAAVFLAWLSALGLAVATWYSGRTPLSRRAAGIAAVLAVGALVAIPLPAVMWDDSAGGGADPGHRSIGIWIFAVAAVAASALLLIPRRPAEPGQSD